MRHVSRIRIGSFNVGVDQNMLTGKRCNKTLKNVEDIITTCVQDSALDIMNMSEVGNHRQGLHACRPPIHADDMEIFQKKRFHILSSESTTTTSQHGRSTPILLSLASNQ